MSPVVEEDEDSGEVGVVQSLLVDTKEKEAEVTKPKSRPRPRTKAEKSTQPSATTNHRKRKTSADDFDGESEMPGRKMATKPGRPRETDSTSKKLSGRAASEEQANTAADPLPKPKKRKINIFAGAGAQSSTLKFDFGSGVRLLVVAYSFLMH